MPELSILIPSRNEEFLTHTVNDILLHMEGDTEILVALDGQWADPPLPVHPRLTVVYHPAAKGQRQSTNALARLSKAKYIMKVDAHVAFDQGFDVKLMARCEPDWTVTPRGYNLLVFHRVCKACGHKNDMGPSVQPCKKCKQIAGFTREMVWKPRLSRKWDSMRFDHELHFNYWGAYTLRPEWAQQGDYHDTMSLLGACWFLRRDRYWELEGMDERHGSWGQMGTELACKTWLSGGRLVCNTTTWFAHLFRTQGADFGFPYPLSGREIERAREWSRDLWIHNRWPKQIHPLSWLLERFAPLPGWHDEGNKAALDKVNDEGVKFVQRFNIVKSRPTKGLVYYTDNQLDPLLLRACQRRLKECANGHDLVSVSLSPIDFGRNTHLPLERGQLTMFKQILAGIEASTADVLFLVEHDLLYHPSHFAFTPPSREIYYFNRNTWKVDAVTGKALHYLCDQVSGCCAYRELLLQHYRRRVERVEKEGKYDRNIGYEPGSHRFPRGIDEYGRDEWMSEWPNIDLRHGKNLSKTRWSQDQFRNKNTCLGWVESDRVPGWGVTQGRMPEFLAQWT